MGQKVNPIGFRVGIYRESHSRWFARGKQYADKLLEDFAIRKYLDEVLVRAEISHIEIEKTNDHVRVIIHSARPGMVIGKKGQEIDTLRHEISKLVKKKGVEISVQEVSQPEFNATLVAKNIAEQLEKRSSFKRVMKRASASMMRGGLKGVKICCSGRLNGAEIARREWLRVGSVPLHTLRADIDYGFAKALTTYGIIGVKVWTCRGEYKLPTRV